MFFLKKQVSTNVGAMGEGGGGGVERARGINRCKLLLIGWINKFLLYSTWDYIQYPVINHHGKKHEKVCVCFYPDTLLCSPTPPLQGQKAGKR